MPRTVRRPVRAHYAQHDDGFVLHYPGDNPDMVRHAAAIRAFGYAMAGLRRVTDNISPWAGTVAPGWYRVIPYTLAGTPGPASPIARLS
jgi:hypothetical protein